MSRLITAFKLILPICFFAYAAVGNFVIFTEDGIDLSGKEIMRGEATGQIDTIYRRDLPHREPSIGLIGAARYAVLGEGREGVIAGQGNWLFSAEELRAYGPDSTVLEETVAKMSEIRDRLAEAGSDLVIVPLPAKIDIDRSFAPTSDAPNVSAAQYQDFLAALSDAGLSTVDVRSELLDAQKTRPAFLQTDTHWHPETAALVASIVAGSKTVPLGDAKFERQAQKDVSFTGDLVSFVTSENLAPTVGLRPETVQPYLAIEAGGGVDLFGSSSAIDVALIGTSYSANENWSFAEALKLALKRDVLNLAQEGQGPVTPMIDYLADGAARLDQPPALIIWEFPVRYLTDPKLWEKSEKEEGNV
ncbi:alginate O-acetyltransferase AlgX-related protein [Litoreibacter roseus]|uniref:Alginate O-acetyltransferase n=1 Tax=Litoreibacter roseus TaxID=2601869 RepID=A0A6N6JDD4_9RHOB|nr:hypothetical protein [Litoreibacter roseus]GFE63202.1 alginate O-acetyltransferase [Litoreibacter roseus]